MMKSVKCKLAFRARSSVVHNGDGVCCCLYLVFVFAQVNYNSLGKSSSNAAVNDPADHLSVVVPQLFGIYVLGTIAFLYFLVDFVSHPIYLIKITEKSSKV